MRPLPAIPRDELTDEQAELHSAILAGSRAPAALGLVDDQGGISGPFTIWLHHPPVGTAVSRLGGSLRRNSGFSTRLRELVILAIASTLGAEFEWDAHERIGLSVGISEDEIETLRAGQLLQPSDEVEAAVLRATVELLRSGDLTDETYAEGERTIGLAGLIELVTLVGFYQLIALQSRAFRVPRPAI